MSRSAAGKRLNSRYRSLGAGAASLSGQDREDARQDRSLDPAGPQHGQVHEAEARDPARLHGARRDGVARLPAEARARPPARPRPPSRSTPPAAATAAMWCLTCVEVRRLPAPPAARGVLRDDERRRGAPRSSARCARRRSGRSRTAWSAATPRDWLSRSESSRPMISVGRRWDWSSTNGIGEGELGRGGLRHPRRQLRAPA